MKPRIWRLWKGQTAGFGAATALLLILSACAAPTRVAAPLPPGAGTARLWFYRDFEPSISLNNANVELNGAMVASVPADGSALYRDVPPGRYRVTVQSFGQDVNQTKTVDLASGQEAYVKILSLGGWESGGDMSQFQRDTFYVSLVPSSVAQAELPRHPLNGG